MLFGDVNSSRGVANQLNSGNVSRGIQNDENEIDSVKEVNRRALEDAIDDDHQKFMEV